MIRKKIPLPFQSNKSKHIDHFIDYITKCPAHTFIDLFGGSCFLSYVVHRLKPQAHVICNDYDNYRERLVNVETTNQILDAIRSITTSNTPQKKPNKSRTSSNDSKQKTSSSIQSLCLLLCVSLATINPALMTC